MKFARRIGARPLHQIALGLTVCLAATCRLVAAENQQLIQTNSNRWIPLTTTTTTTNKTSAGETSSSNKRTEFSTRKEPTEAAANGRERSSTANEAEVELLEAAASVMAPIERVARYQPARDAQDEEDADEADEAADAPEPLSRDKLGRQNEDIGRPQQSGDNNIDSGDQADLAAAEQEAAEASEAEAADRSALDEQMQQQQEIIRAQAASEAKAIREQQEALLRLQTLQSQLQQQQQQPTARKRQQLSSSTMAAATSPSGSRSSFSSRSGQQPTSGGKMYHRNHNHRQSAINHQQQQRRRHSADSIQFSDQPDRSGRNHLMAGADLFHPSSSLNQAASLSAEAGQNTERVAGSSGATGLQALPEDIMSSQPPTHGLMDDIESAAASGSAQPNGGGGDLHAAAQHHYGSHYGSVKGHHGDYYQ